ncbi:conserved Plasmodium protein, unknown function [Plasmodium gallinaceum]|uniref:Uncharacterized protein n=1 Tax=Plasmodium gallinaceum TaxID=5849 RepID=A0A1J1GV84_PLAGA|nr:conserved Plasmodium protein, unknown function [Plasmodium gallinaceum]CRG95209.1 conserved Plasmodium protein, unknown function [Plasmodium gallinaceum]
MKKLKEKTSNNEIKLQKYMDKIWGFSDDEKRLLNEKSKKKDKIKKNTYAENKKLNIDDEKKIISDLKNKEQNDNLINKVMLKKDNNQLNSINMDEKKKKENQKKVKSKNHLNVTNNVNEKMSVLNNIQKKENIEIHSSDRRLKEKNNNIKKRFEKKNHNKFDESKKKEIYKEKMKLKKDFMETVHEIRKISLPFLNKFQKKIVENHQIKTLGGKFDKSRKIHYPELMCRKKSMKKYISKRKEKEKILGVKIQSGNYIDMQDVFRKKRKEKKIQRKLF